MVMLAGACAMSASKVPLDNANPEGPDIYFYGTPDHGGKSLKQTGEGDAPHKPLVLPKPPSLVKAKKVAKVKKKTKATRADAGASVGDGGAVDAQWAGRYAGTDTVIVSFPGIPPDPQVDDNAKMDVVRLSDDRLSVSVVDSQRGVPLCTVEGDFEEGNIELDDGQECFSDMLGIPVDTSLQGGTGTIDGEKLTVDFVVEMSIDTPSGLIEGGIDYHFEGTKVDAEEDSD
jgi:hypothetical protein